MIQRIAELTNRRLGEFVLREESKKSLLKLAEAGGFLWLKNQEVKVSATPLNDIGTSRSDLPLTMTNDNGTRSSSSAMSSLGELAAMKIRVVSDRQQKAEQELTIDEKAEYLVKKFDAPRSRAFYCDCVRYLNWTYITETVDYVFAAHKKPIRNPAAYFGRVMTNALVDKGIYT